MTLRTYSALGPSPAAATSSASSSSSEGSALAWMASKDVLSLSRKTRREVRCESPIQGSVCETLTSTSGLPPPGDGDSSTRAVRFWHFPNRLRL